MNALMCMNHPHVDAEPGVAEWGPPLCVDCAISADLPNLPDPVPDWLEEAAYWEDVARRQARTIARMSAKLAALGTARPTQGVVGSWLRETFGPQQSQHQALVLAEEVGEVCRAVVKRAQGVRGTRAEWTTELRKELGDVQLVLYALAECEGLDLDELFVARWAAVTARDSRVRRLPEAS